MGSKIPVTVIAGGRGDGNAALLSRLLDQPDGVATHRIVVLSHACRLHLPGNTEIVMLDPRIFVRDGACPCCVVHGELVQALRERFLDALHRKAPAFSHVFIALAQGEDPAAILYTLQFDVFLRDRYEYNGCVTVVLGQEGVQGLHDHPEVLRQILLGDVLMINDEEESDLAPQAWQALRDCLHGLNPEAAILRSGEADALRTLVFRPEGLQSALCLPASLPLMQGGLWRQSALQGATGYGIGKWNRVAHRLPAGVQVLTARWESALSRSAMLMAISRLQETFDPGLLRVSGELVFVDDARRWRVRGIHGQLYPLRLKTADQPETGPAGQSDGSRSVLVMIFQGQARGRAEDAALSILPPEATLVSSASNCR